MIEKKIIKILETVVKKKINFKKQKKLVSDGLLDSFSIQLEKFDINCFNSITSIKKLILKK
jgi:hypothetical protein